MLTHFPLALVPPRPPTNQTRFPVILCRGPCFQCVWSFACSPPPPPFVPFQKKTRLQRRRKPTSKWPFLVDPESIYNPVLSVPSSDPLLTNQVIPISLVFFPVCRLTRVVGSLGVYPPPSVIQVGLPSFCGWLVFGRPFLLYHRGGFHFPSPELAPPCFGLRFWGFPFSTTGQRQFSAGVSSSSLEASLTRPASPPGEQSLRRVERTRGSQRRLRRAAALAARDGGAAPCGHRARGRRRPEARPEKHGEPRRFSFRLLKNMFLCFPLLVLKGIHHYWKCF